MGCGPGFFTVPAATIVGDSGSLVALDVNPAAVEHVHQKIEASGLTNARVVCADAGGTDLPDRSFDLAFVFGLGHAVGGAERIWREIHRLLKPEGTLSIEGRLRPPTDLFRPVSRRGRIAVLKKTG